MPFFRLRATPGRVWPSVCDPVHCQVWAAYLELDRTQWLDPAQIEAGQLHQVRVLLAHCLAHVPYYRQTLAASIDPASINTFAAFRRLPLLSRRFYQENSDRFIAETLPDGMAATVIAQTSGSSGAPTRVFQTNAVHFWWRSFFLRDLEWAGINPAGRLAAIRSAGKDAARVIAGVSAPSWLGPLQPLLECGQGYLMEISQDPRLQLQWLRRIAPDYILSYPANLEVLASMAAADGPLPGLQAICSISDTLTPETQAAIESAFQVPVKNSYSCAEAGYLASPCPLGHGLHVHEENVLFEVLDDADNPCPPGQTGRVFITTLNNFRGPLLRYELGDFVVVGPDRCPCGRGLRLLSRVQGKNSPMFLLPDGRHKSSTHMAYVVRKVGGHFQHQVAQKSRDHVIVRIVPNPDWTDAHAAQMRQKIQAFFEAPIRVDVELHSRIPLPPSGKFQNMLLEFA